MKLVVLESLSVGSDISWDALSAFGELTLCRDLKQEEVRAVIADADIIIPNKLLINEAVLEGSRVKLVCEAATGYNNIDLDYCHKHQITVTNVSGYSTNSVVQHTIASLLYLYEKLDYYNHFTKNGHYSASDCFSHFGKTFHELTGKRWGIVGLGQIGRQVANVAESLGACVVYYSASGHQYEVPYEAVSFDVLLETCDVITIHCPLTPQTKGLFNANAFQKMKSDAILVNVARGPVVIEKDLAQALLNNELAAAALDVFEQEPFSNDNPLLSIQDNTRLLLTPHNAWGSVEARTRLISEVAENIRCYLNGTPRNCI